jgi:hypothetical protein
MLLAEVTSNAHGVPDIICTLLLIATVVAFILGLAEVLGFGFGSQRTGNGRFATLLVAVILLVVYVVLC